MGVKSHRMHYDTSYGVRCALKFKGDNFMIEIIDEIEDYLEKIQEEEFSCSEGSLDMYYDDIINSLEYMKLLWITFNKEYIKMIDGKN